MARWQRRARLGFGLFAVAFAAVLWFTIGERTTPAALPPVVRLDPKAVSEITGGDVVQIKGAKRDVRVEFATQVSYSDGAMRYTGFKAHIDDRGGRSFSIAGQEAHVAPQQSAFDVRGDVTLQTSDGLTAKTGHATFAEAEGIVRGPGPVQFQRERVSGSGVGFTYDRSLDRLALLDRAVINVAPKDGAGAMAVTAGAASHSRAERFMRFERNMRMERQNQIIEAETSTVFLLPDRDEPQTVELRGRAAITGAAGAGALQAMRARDINLHYAADGRTLERALLVGDSGIDLARPDGALGQQLSAQTLELTLAADQAVTGLIGRDRVRLQLPPDGERSARTVTAQILNGTGAAGRGLTNMTFEQDVVYAEESRGDALAREARARVLNAGLSDAGGIDEAHFSGGFRFREGALNAESIEAAYHVGKGTLALRGPDGAPRPRIRDERIDLNAASIDVTLAPRHLSATGKVSAIFAAGRREGERGASVLNEREPVLIISETLTFDEATAAGTYRGGARLWQESGNSIRGDAITVNEKTGTLSAEGDVITSLPLAARQEDGTTRNSIARAGTFQFDDVKRHAVFVKKAQLDGSQGNLSADRIELMLAAKGNELEQLTAHGAVTVALDKREATGQHLVYQPADAKYVLNGTPVKLVQGCQESSGRTVTFYRDSERVSVDGNEQTRVQTKGGKCPDPARD